jgi:PilZ domain
MLAHAPGRPASSAGTTYAATLEEWQSEPGGLTVIAEVSADAETMQAVSGRNVWVSFSSPSDALIVVAALARERIASPGRIELTGVRMLAYEPRRRSLRAGLTRPVRLYSGGRTHEATTLDLSRGGCRVFTEHPGDPLDPGSPGNLAAGYALAVSVELDDGLVLEADALVVRADGPELALRFTGLAATDAAEVDAAVFRELVRNEG